MMETTTGILDWESSRNETFLNPRLNRDQADLSKNLLNFVNVKFKGHVFLLTSGTTVASDQDFKWVALSKYAFLTSARAVNSHLQSDSKDIWLHPLPDFHVGGLGIWARSHLSGAKVIQMGKWNVSDFLNHVITDQITLTSLVPTQVYDLVRSNIVCPPSLRAILVGGSALAFALYQKALEQGWPLLPTYGMTELCSQAATARFETLSYSIKDRREFKRESLPDLHILPHLEVEEGEGHQLKFRGESLLTSYIYWNRSSSQANNKDSFVLEDPKKGGWFYSQDCGFVNNRTLEIKGRLGDFIKIGGEGVEVGRLRQLLEEIRLQMDIPSDLVIVAVPDERLGFVIQMVSDRNLSPSDAMAIMDQFNSKVLPFEKIRKWNILDQIPRTTLGKLIPSAVIEKVINLNF